MEDFSGKTAFITGGASGLGLAIAKACVKEGMNVALADLRQSAIDEALPYFAENGYNALGLQLDVTDREAYAKAADQTEAAFGNIHLLVNNAGIGCTRGPLWDVSFRETDLAIDINLTAVLNGIQIIVPRMLKHGEGGHIVSTSSKAAIIPVPFCGLYNFTKQAVIAVMETLAEDLEGTNIGSSVFCPGPFKSSLGQTTVDITEELLGEKPKDPPPMKGGKERPSFEEIWTLTRPAEEAAERVIRGVKRGDLYILTHSEFKEGFSARVNAMLRAFPDEPPQEAFIKTFDFLVQNPVFDKQTQVPALQ